MWRMKNISGVFVAFLSICVAQAGLKLKTLPLLPEDWDYKYVPPCSDMKF
jgi:hypothetical protein